MCVYALRDPRDGIEFYIGIGSKESRPWDHFKHTNGNQFRWNKIQKLRRAGVADDAMVVHLARDVPAVEACYLEEQLIEFLGRRSTGDGPLTNLTPGGDRSPLDDPVTRKKHQAYLNSPGNLARLAARNNSPEHLARLRANGNTPENIARLTVNKGKWTIAC